jgi:hypothetical protein
MALMGGGRAADVSRVSAQLRIGFGGPVAATSGVHPPIDGRISPRAYASAIVLRVTLAALAVAAVMALASPAQAYSPDPGAPPGASIDWLPNVEWVQQRWLPFSEPTLEQVLRADRQQIQDWVHARRTLWDLARRNGVDPRAAVRTLAAPWKSTGARHQREMRARTRQVLTHAHLAQHMLFHTFHVRAVNASWPQVFGVGVAQTYAEMRSLGLCYLQVGARHRGSAAVVQRDFASVLRGTERAGVRGGDVLPVEGRRNLQFQLAQMVPWLLWRPTLGAPAS